MRHLICLFLAVLVITTVNSKAYSEGNNMKSSVTAKVISAELTQRYPRSFWNLTLTLQNTSSETRWFLVSKTLEKPIETVKESGGFYLYQLPSDQGNVIYARLDCQPNLYVFRVPAKSELTLNGFQLESWVERNVPEFEIWSVKEIKESGKKISKTWLKGKKLLVSKGTTETKAVEPEEIWDDLFDAVSVLSYEDIQKIKITLDFAGIDSPWGKPSKDSPEHIEPGGAPNLYR